MSRAARQSIIILIVLLLAAFGFAGLTLSEKVALEKKARSLEVQISEYQSREKQQLLENKKLADHVAEVEKQKTELQDRFSKVDVNISDLTKQVDTLTKERDQWKKRVDELRGERDDLVTKIQQKPAVTPTSQPQPAAGQVPSENPAPAPAQPEPGVMEPKPDYSEPQPITTPAEPEPATAPAAPELGATLPSSENEEHWAQVLKEKAGLELELENLKKNVSDTAVEVVELKKANSDLQLEISRLQDEKAGIEREIKHGKDLADSLSLELARSNNDKQYLNDRLQKMGDENSDLRNQIKMLSTTKIALEKSIVNLQEEKKDIEKRLVESENVIQQRIDQIWKLKDDLSKDFKPYKAVSANEVELPPIVVNAEGPQASPSVDQNVGKAPGFDGNVVSINDENNFVIVDIGEASGLKIGDTLNVYRGADYVAALEIIQLRKDIAAADIKKKVAKIKVGDIVR